MNSLYLKYNSGVNTESKDAIKNCVTDLINKSKNKEFFSDINIFITKDLNDNTLQKLHNKPLAKHLEFNYLVNAIAINPYMNYNKQEIFIKTEHKELGIFKSKLNNDELRHYTTHELGHLFDYYFGENHDDNIIKMLSDIEAYEKDNEYAKMWEELVIEYTNECHLSDTDEFKNAWKKDVENLGKLNFLERNYKKFVLQYSNPTNYSGIDITDGIDEEEMKLAEIDRSETFAQLFSYALGNEAIGIEDEDITKNVFKNTYAVVKNYIEKFLGVECK